MKLVLNNRINMKLSGIYDEKLLNKALLENFNLKNVVILTMKLEDVFIIEREKAFAFFSALKSYSDNRKLNCFSICKIKNEKAISFCIVLEVDNVSKYEVDRYKDLIIKTILTWWGEEELVTYYGAFLYYNYGDASFGLKKMEEKDIVLSNFFRKYYFFKEEKVRLISWWSNSKEEVIDYIFKWIKEEKVDEISFCGESSCLFENVTDLLWRRNYW